MVDVDETVVRDRLIKEAGMVVYDRRKDLQKAFPDPTSDEYWCWLNSYGVLEEPLLRRVFPEVPPEQVRRYVGAPEERWFLLSASQIYADMAANLSSHGMALSDFKSILDFGCGCGRVSRLLHREVAKGAAITGVDVDEEKIRWLQDYAWFGTWAHIKSTPPTKLAATAFDFVFAISVFSHLSEKGHRAWLQELARVMKPGGFALLTVLGDAEVAALEARPEKREFANVSTAQVAKAKKALAGQGFYFLRQDDGHLEAEQYGVTFISKAYVESVWSQYFEVVGWQELGVHGQDAVIVKAR